jgi:trehalose 6-phosphate synthase/phosphatase
MQRLIIVSNRLPVTVEKRKGEISFRGSVGGVATGLGSYHETHESIWVGWAEVSADRLDAPARQEISSRLADEHSCVPVFLSADDVRDFYHGFCNRTIWPMFHHFLQYAEFHSELWAAYERVSTKYCDAVLEVAKPGDTIWIQDYQLMLLPGMLRKRMPDATIGFFLHIPFPAFELFRALPWRREVLEGLLGADLVGFHTYDYVRYFLGSARRLLGTDDQYGRINVDDRIVLVDAFPMGIDYDRYEQGARTPKARAEIARIGRHTAGRKVVLSIDRLDYSKGIPQRLRAYDKFLDRHPEWKSRVVMVCVAVPSRTRVEHYRLLKAEVDELVGGINGRHGTIDWTPVRYLYQSLPFSTLSAMYGAADVAYITPVRDGMNLIAKEYLAARGDNGGVLVLSEIAGAARELGEAVQVNPYDHDAMIEALAIALTMPEEEQRARNASMQRRLRRYTVQRWAEDFLGSLEQIKLTQVGFDAHLLDEWQRERLLCAYRAADRRVILLDYDGTLMPFADKPQDVVPSESLMDTLRALSADERNQVVVISGRDRDTLDEWLGGLNIDLVAEHGVWLRETGREWLTIEPMNDEWKPRIRPTLDMYVDRTPGSFVEEKDYSLVWHYRKIHPELAETRVRELKDALTSMAADAGLALLDGNRVLEVRAQGVNKGRAAHRWMGREETGFVLAIGDDRTDEDVFEAAPDGSWTIKVGRGATHANHSVRSVQEVRELLTRLTEVEV